MSTNIQLKSRLNADAKLEVFLEEAPMPEPAADEVLIRVEASPINPSDLGVLFGAANVDAGVAGTANGHPSLIAPVAEQLLPRLAARVGKALPVGNEGAGTVVGAGSSAAAQSLMGKTVAGFGGGMYAQYRCINIMNCLPMKEGTTAAQAASGFVNPMTSLSMVENMRLENHTALVHTAAASNLGQMLNRICLADGVDLVNIVRKQEQADLLKGMGAKYVVNSSDANFREALTDALAETGASIAFDATGGGKLASDILTAMETAANRDEANYSIYGSTKPKQVYLYGSLDMSPTILNRNYGMTWSVGGWLLPPFLQRLEVKRVLEMRQRVTDEITTTFASNYSHQVSFEQMLQPDVAKRYNLKATGDKYLLLPNG